MSISSRDVARVQHLAVRSPGSIARRRARGGIVHRRGRVGVGYRSAVGAVHLDLDALNHHGYVGGAPGSGKTTLLRLLIEGYPGPVIALDAKGSPELADTVWSLSGHVWEIGGPLKLDLLDPEPAMLAQQLLEGEIFTDRAAV
jgi:DNA helicase HerA-like ATPase